MNDNTKTNEGMMPLSDADGGTYMYAAPGLDPFPQPPNQPSVDGYSTVTWTTIVPPRTFKWNTPEHWAWWRGYIGGNAVTAYQMLDAIEEDRRACAEPKED